MMMDDGVMTMPRVFVVIDTSVDGSTQYIIASVEGKGEVAVPRRGEISGIQPTTFLSVLKEIAAFVSTDSSCAQFANIPGTNSDIPAFCFALPNEAFITEFFTEAAVASLPPFLRRYVILRDFLTTPVFGVSVDDDVGNVSRQLDLVPPILPCPRGRSFCEFYLQVLMAFSRSVGQFTQPPKSFDETETVPIEEMPEVPAPAPGTEAVVRMRGIPWGSDEEAIRRFFEPIAVRDVLLVKSAKTFKLTGDAYVELERPEDLEMALKKDRERMGSRYIEIFESSKVEIDRAKDPQEYNRSVARTMRKIVEEHPLACAVKMRGLSFESTEASIIRFLEGYSFFKESVSVILTEDGIPGGLGVVIFDSASEAQKAIHEKDRDLIGKRYVEMFTLPGDELERFLRDVVDSRGAVVGDEAPEMNERRCILVRGLPYDANENNIFTFFIEYPVVRGGIHILKDPDGRSSGNAVVEFQSVEIAHAAQMALDRRTMGPRFLELFLTTKRDMMSRLNSQSRSSHRSSHHHHSSSSRHHDSDRYYDRHRSSHSRSYRPY